MKKYMLLGLLFSTACVGTDSFDDQIVSLTIDAADAEVINNATSTLIGGDIRFTVSAINDRGVTYEPTVDWTISDSTIARINENGEFTTLQTGTVEITASTAEVSSDPVQVSIVNDPNEIALVEIISPLAVIDVDQTITLEARVLNVDREEIDGVDVTWSSNDLSVATVNPRGEVTGESTGTVLITARAGNKTATQEITVAGSSERTGTFRGLNGYRVEGDVALVLDDNGRVSIQLGENFRSSRGPGLYVFLGRQEGQASFEVEALRSTSGADEYELPASIDINEFDHVVIYCLPFGAPFGSAALSEALGS